MNDAIYQRIESNPLFRELVNKRQRFAVFLSLIMLVLYVGFILLIAFALLAGNAYQPSSSITRGIPIGVGLIAISFILTGIYVYRANGEFDRLTKQLLDEVKQ